ncbi:hypothetical protein F8388_019666 [Cannabis sativa]|uniref:Uncharacterized protein n=1 Tax=Cannabis sativa TaxID=3483 RepID=A0A7J6E2F1_CANSA|nr:hypothetical protein F8388_019666 [Cannabis sativa]
MRQPRNCPNTKLKIKSIHLDKPGSWFGVRGIISQDDKLPPPHKLKLNVEVSKIVKEKQLMRLKLYTKLELVLFGGVSHCYDRVSTPPKPSSSQKDHDEGFHTANDGKFRGYCSHDHHHHHPHEEIGYTNTTPNRINRWIAGRVHGECHGWVHFVVHSRRRGQQPYAIGSRRLRPRGLGGSAVARGTRWPSKYLYNSVIHLSRNFWISNNPCRYWTMGNDEEGKSAKSDKTSPPATPS